MADTFVLAAYKAIGRELKAADVRFMVVGDLAVYAYGGQRVTHDVDLVIQLEADRPQFLVGRFQDDAARCICFRAV